MDVAIKEIELYLTQVHCADCVRDLISDVVLKLDGAQGAEFDESENALRVTFDETRLTEANIRQAIAALGYGFREADEAPDKVSGMQNLLIVGAILIGAAFVILWSRSF